MINDDWEPLLEVPRAKITEYLLNVDHPEGGAKARYFIAFGFHPDRPLELASALLAQVEAFGPDMSVTEIDGHKRLVFEGAITSPDGRNPRVRTVWQLHAGIAWRLVTAYPRK